MRRTDALVTAARTLSRNSANTDSTLAVTTDEILQYLNDGQDRIQNLISARKNIAKIFATQTIISLVASQESYTIPDRVLLNKQIEMVEFSYDGGLANYTVLKKVDVFNRNTDTSNYPWGYFKRGGAIFLTPVPSAAGGTIRVTYERDLDDLDIPRGVVSSITTGTSAQFAALVFDSTADSYESTTPGWSNIQYSCIVSAIGARKCYNILTGSYTAGTNTLVPSPNPFVYNTTLDSQIAAGDVAVFGKYTTTYSQLPDACERYLIHYAAMELFNRDSSDDYSKEADRVAEIEEDILKALASQTGETQYISSMNTGEWGF